ncbi:MAG: glycosyltransferase family 39 protein [Planctomycetota bacterium]|nr:glycosyltransferase family 39 protein [Planctomycetota bacterium]
MNHEASDSEGSEPGGSGALGAQSSPGFPGVEAWCRSWGLWLVLILAGLARLAYGIEHTNSPDYAWPSVDAQYHDVWARSAAGLPYPQLAGFVDPELASTPSLRPAGYPWFLALVYKLTGGSYLAARWVQHLMGLLSVALVWFALRDRIGAWLGVAAAGLFALHFAPVYFEGELQATGLLIFLNLLGLHLFMGALERGGARRVIGAGLVLGLATLVRPNVLLPAALLGMYLLRRGVPPLPRPRVALFFALGLGMGILPGTVRNWVRAGEFLPLTATGGINLYLGQGPNADGLIQGNMGELGRFQTCFDYSAVKRHVERKVGEELTFGELDRWFMGQALSSMAADPGRAISLMAVKAGLLFSGEEVGHNKEVGLERKGSWALRFLPVPFVGLLALLIWGLIAAVAGSRSGGQGPGLGERARDLFAVHGLWTLGFVISLVPFFAASRYRTPLIPHFAVLAALGLSVLWVRRSPRSLWLGSGVVAAVLAFCITSLDQRYKGPHAYKYHLDRGMAAADQDRLELAQREFAAAESADPGNPAVAGEVAKMYLRSEQWDLARAGFEGVLAQDPGHPSALYNLGWIAERQGRWAEALDSYLAAWESQPTQALTEQALKRLVLQLGTHPEGRKRNGRAAADCMQAWLALRPSTLPDLALLAAAQAESGAFKQALETVDQALSMVGVDQKNSAVVRGLQSARKRYAMGQPLRMAPKSGRTSQ